MKPTLVPGFAALLERRANAAALEGGRLFRYWPDMQRETFYDAIGFIKTYASAKKRSPGEQQNKMNWQRSTERPSSSRRRSGKRMTACSCRTKRRHPQFVGTKDGKWHTGDCSLLTEETRSGEHMAIGSTAKKPAPPKDQMCRKCWPFLFPANAPAEAQRRLGPDVGNSDGGNQCK